MFDQLVLSVVLSIAELALVWFVFEVPALVVVAVADCRKVLGTVLAHIGPLTGVRSQVDCQVTSFCEAFTTVVTNEIRDHFYCCLCFHLQLGELQ